MPYNPGCDMKRFFLIIALMFVLLPGIRGWAADAAVDVPAASVADPAGDIARIESYLQHLTTAKANFLQNTEGSKTASGVFYLSRPGKMRFAYNEPANSFLVADGDYIYFWDAPMKQASQTSLDATIANLLLRPDIKLSGDITVDTVSHLDDEIMVMLHLTKDPNLGTMTMRFQNEPLKMLGWRVVDAQGVVSDVSLDQMETGMTLDKKLFYFSRPNFGSRY